MIRSPDSGRRGTHDGVQAASIFLLTSAVLLTAWNATAADWSATSVLSERVEFDDNLGIDIDSPGDIVSATSSATLDLVADDPHYRFNANGALSYRAFGGPGSDEETNTVTESINTGLDIPGPTYGVGLSGSFSRRDATFTSTLEDFEELGVITVQTNRISFSAAGNVNVDINSTNSLNFAANARTVDFDATGSNLTPFVDYGFSTGWSTKVSGETTGTLGASVSMFEADNDENTETVTYSATGSVTTDINERLTLIGLVGLNIIDSTQTVGGVSVTSTSIGPLFDVGLSYTLGVTDFSASVSQNVSSSALGDLRERRTYRMGLGHQVNSRESFRVQASYSTQDTVSDSGGTAQTTFISVAPTYTVSFTRYWTFSFGYQFRYQDDEDGSAMSNKVFGTLSREIALLP